MNATQICSTIDLNVDVCYKMLEKLTKKSTFNSGFDYYL